MRTRVLPIIAVGLGLTAPAAAGPRITTPALVPPLTGGLWCDVVNASDEKEIVVDIFVYSANGAVVCPLPGVVIPPNSGNVNFCQHDSAHHCAVTVRKGGKKNAVVSVTARDVIGDILGSLPAAR